MRKSDRILVMTLAAAFAVSVAYTFYHTIVEERFDVVNFESEPGTSG